jgi:hypothetical protein
MGTKIIETAYDGYLFRSRTEARWAVWFSKLGIEYEYEKEGFDLDGVRYLPDFWIPIWCSWVEIKGNQATDSEIAKCRALAAATEKQVLLVVGSPRQDRYNVAVISAPGEWDFGNPSEVRGGYFATGRRDDYEYWVRNDDEGAICLNPRDIDNSGKYPLESDRIIAAYEAASRARFEKTR